jgi:hypothetical protein
MAAALAGSDRGASVKHLGKIINVFSGVNDETMLLWLKKPADRDAWESEVAAMWKAGGSAEMPLGPEIKDGVRRMMKVHDLLREQFYGPQREPVEMSRLPAKRVEP